MKAKIAILAIAAMISAPTFAQEKQAQIFEQKVFSAQTPVNAVELSHAEMRSTEGDAIWFAPAILAGARVALTGFTRHGLQQVIARNGVGVSNKVIMNTMRNPVKVVQQSGGRTKFIGADKGAVVLNSQGKVITAWGKPR